MNTQRETVQRTYLRDYAPPAFLVDSADLRVELNEERTLVTNKMRLRRNPRAVTGPVILDGCDLELIRIAVDDRVLAPGEFSLKGETLRIDNVRDTFVLETVTACNPAANTTNRGLYLIGSTFVTQCEPEGFRRLTFFPDRPDILARFSVRLAGDVARTPILLSNGNLKGAGRDNGGRHWVYWVDPHPKPSYIFAIVAGDLGELKDTFTTQSGRSVALSIFAEKNVVGLCRNAMTALRRAFSWDERTFGLECDLDRYNVVALTGYGGAMENKGLNVFDSNGIVADPAVTTDDDALLIERIIAHEYFHNWTGNRVTCRDWFQLSLKEGLTRYRDQHFGEDLVGEGFYRIETVKALMRNQFPEDDGPAAHPIKPEAYSTVENFYTNTIYEKGAEIVRMMATLVGEERFRRAFDLYIARHDGQAVTTEEFVKAVEDGAGIDLRQFRRWYSTPGRPRLEMSGAYDPPSRRYTLAFKQSCQTLKGGIVSQPFHIPVRIGLISKRGSPLSFRLPHSGLCTEEAILELREAASTFVLEDVEEDAIASVLRGFSAPVTLSLTLDESDLALLAAHDADPYVRWNAFQTMLIAHIRKQATNFASGREMSASERLLDVIARILGAENDGMLKSQLLAIPDEPVLSEGVERVPLDEHMAARGSLQRAVGERFCRELIEILDAPTLRDAQFPDLKAIGARRLKAIALEFLMAAGVEGIAARALFIVQSATNMTDVFNALSVLVHHRCPEQDLALAWFYDRWKDFPTVIDKWFGVQALSRMEGAVDHIIALEGHPAFDIRNTARGIAYYGSFFRQNRVAFHDPSGKGYEFLADRLLTIDRMGRPGGHWLMAQINQWRRYDAKRQTLMQKALRRVADTPGISNGLRDLTTQSLGDK